MQYGVGGGAGARRAQGRRGRQGQQERKGRQGRQGPEADLFIEGLGPVPVLVDVRVTHSLAPSHVEACAADEETPLREAEAEKHRAYRVLADQIGAKFFAFAVETTGRLGNDALAFIKYLIAEGARFKNVWAPKEVVNGIYRTVAIAIARGNAEIIESNLRKSRQAEWNV